MARISCVIPPVLLAYLTLGNVLAETSTDKVHKKVCIRDTNVNPSLVEKAFDGDFSDNRELKCFFRCYHMESGFLNDKGEIQTDQIKSKISTKADKKTIGQAIDSCKSVTGSDSCETAYKLQKCLHEKKVMLA